MQSLVRRVRQKHRERNGLDPALYFQEDNGSCSRTSEGAMNHFSAEKLEEIRQQMALHRKNLLCICRLAIRSLVERAHSEGVDDSCDEFKNLATILEHILSHRLKGQISWFGLEEPREFWDFISAACSSLPHNCIDNIANMEDAKKPKAKGRAWIRSALMEKRLAEYIQHTLKDEKALKAFFGEGAFMRSEEAQLVAAELEKLNTIDFSSCLRGEKLETGVAHVIDYSSYLQILLRNEEIRSDTCSLQAVACETNGTEGSSESHSRSQAGSTADEKYTRLQEQFRAVCAQKDYLEDTIQQRDRQLASSKTECKHLQQALKHTDQMARHEHQQLQKTIIQLQAKVVELEEARQMARVSLEKHLIKGQWNPPAPGSDVTPSTLALLDQPESISLDNLHLALLPNEMPSPDEESVRSLDQSYSSRQCDSPSPTSAASSSSLYVRSDSDRGQRSIQRDKEETQSLIPLAGSFTSQMSVRSTETSSSGMLDSDTHLYRVRPMSPGSVSSDSCVSSDVNQPLVVS
ncbi:RUN domain-containing protein 3B-like [Patiria miniata]|uniref:RUN domain-containing protein n=1 Tax=Patiria miniata TaxID=46514 RepID=A0A914BRR1_PATMI|nr:RUN domain-containing protein 3B-like [Patiria miniata]XP_038078650.1 RUN domain-containing protein 3B-like [Patiria miniata]